MADQTTGSRSDVRSFWDTSAARYDEYFDERSGEAHALRARLAATVILVGSGPGKALDAGMGPGRLCAELERRGWAVHGVDASSEMVAIARSRLPNAAERLVQGTIEALPFDDASFDRVTATGVLEYATVSDALSELARVLKPNGIAVVSYPNPYAVYGMWKTWVYYPLVRLLKWLRTGQRAGLPHGAGPIPPKAFVALLQRAGLEPTSCLRTSVLPILAPVDQVLPRLAASIAVRLEGRARARSFLATQIVYGARKIA